VETAIRFLTRRILDDRAVFPLDDAEDVREHLLLDGDGLRPPKGANSNPSGSNQRDVPVTIL
ncbi:hypothetical protein SELSPUOL_01515, partial [Selenomonas sputigena ATCC 35185]